MQGSRDYGLVFSDEEVWSWDQQAKQPAVRWALKVVHRAGKKLLAGDAAEPPLEALLDGRDEATLDRLLGFSVEPTIEPAELFAIAAVLKPADVHLAVQMLVAVSRWYVEVLLEGRDDEDLLALLTALARFLEAHDVSPREVLDCYGRDAIGQRAG